jgi:Mrp family chromosome partitioning ATPase/capsular polysaccharide biosynthesis protein
VELPPASGGELSEFVRALRRQAWVLLLVTALVVAAGTALVMRRSATWTSTASLLVPAVDEGAGARGDSVVDLNTERQVLRSNTVAALAAERLDGAGVGLDDADPEDLVARVAVEVPVDTRVLRVTVTGDSAEQARALNRAFLSSYRDLAYLNAVRDRNELLDVLDTELEAADEDLEETNDDMAAAPTGSSDAFAARSRREVVTDRITSLEDRRAELLATAVPAVRVLSAATEGTTTDQDLPVRDLVLVVFAGLVLGAIAAIARDRFDDRMRDVDAFEEALGAPVLATIPDPASKSRSDVTQLVVVDDPSGAAADAYRQLRVGVLGSPEVPGGTILVAGVRGGEGASAVTANLAMALAATGRSVAVVVIDDERPDVAARFEVDGYGLAEVLAGEEQLDDVVRQPRWLPVSILPRGGEGVPVGDLLQSDAMHRLHRSLLSESDFVLLAAPPVLAAADAVALASLADAAVVVATPRRTSRSDLRAARSRLGRVGFPLLGVVLHGTPPAPPEEERRPDEDPFEDAPPVTSGDSAAGADEEEAPVHAGVPH